MWDGFVCTGCGTASPFCTYHRRTQVERSCWYCDDDTEWRRCTGCGTASLFCTYHRRTQVERSCWYCDDDTEWRRVTQCATGGCDDAAAASPAPDVFQCTGCGTASPFCTYHRRTQVERSCWYCDDDTEWRRVMRCKVIRAALVARGAPPGDAPDDDLAMMDWWKPIVELLRPG
eukprot:gene33767-39943_t